MYQWSYNMELEYSGMIQAGESDQKGDTNKKFGRKKVRLFIDDK